MATPTPASPHCSVAQKEEDPASPAQNPITMNQQPREQEDEVLEERNLQSDPPVEERNPQQSSETLTLELPDPQRNSPQADAQDPELQLNENFINDQDPDDQDGSTSFSPRITDAHASVFSPTLSRRGPKRKKMSLRRRFAQEKSQKKLEILIDTFKPIPFVPAKNLDFSSHEKLLKRLGLWDFVHTKFDRSIRHDLLLQFVANFNNNLRCSYVNEIRIRVNRADLARALGLPVKKVTIVDDEDDAVASEESISFIEDFVSNWLLLHEDTWMMPNEVMNWTKVIKEGKFERVDWAGLIWFMVEKELMQSPQLVNCYYASHLQCLIRSQREDLLKEGEAEVEEVGLKEEREQEQEQEEEQEREQEQEEEQEDEDEVCNERLKIGGNDGSLVSKLEEHNIELCLGQDNVDKVDVEKERASIEDMMDLIQGKEEQGQWHLDGKSSAPGPLLRRCHTNAIKEFDIEEEKKALGGDGQGKGEEEEEEEEDDEGEDEDEEGEFRQLPKSNPLDGFPSGQFIQEMETEQIPFSSGLELHDHSPVEFLPSRDDSRMISGGCSMPFGNSNKRVIDRDVDNPHQSLSGGNKRLRSSLVDYDTCMDHVQHWVGKARMMYAEKEQACQQSNVNQQYLLHELQQRESFIEHLRKAKFEEQQKMQSDVYRLERELYVMGNLLEGYRKALRETRKAFEEYRARCPQSDEPLYKDVAGSGGLVLSTMELERIRLKQAEEDRLTRLVIEKKFKDLEDKFVDVFGAHHQEVSSLGNRLLDVGNEVKSLRESFAKRRAPEPSESIPNE